MNKRSLIVFLTVLISDVIGNASAILSAASEVSCGRSMIRRGRVKGGIDAIEGEFPWLVSIRFSSGRDSIHLCGGSLVHSRFVLTAAHCMQNKALKYINVMAGEYDVKGRSLHEQIRSIRNVFMHNDFAKGYLNDIAILELNEPVTWSSFVRPICLPDSSVDAGSNSLDSQMMTVAGWGVTDENSKDGRNPRILQKVNVPVVDKNTCQKWFEIETNRSPNDPQYVHIYEENHICAGYAEGKQDSCTGDSGGPLMKIDNSGREVIVGIVSSGSGCGRPKVPGIYTRIVTYIPWIRSILASQGVSVF
ncbi:UNVERIFIED_CONTAM: hypothetical protein RMT77_001874 [Armadillidium vulgare]